MTNENTNAVTSESINAKHRAIEANEAAAKLAAKLAKRASTKQPKQAATKQAATCSVAQIARSLSMNEKIARAKCRRHRDFFKTFKPVANASVWTFDAKHAAAIAKFLQS